MSGPGSATRPPGDGPWWASGRSPQEGVDEGQDPFDSHARARSGAAPGSGSSPLGAEALDLLLRVLGQARRSTAGPSGEDERATGSPGNRAHPDDSVCEACPVCIALRAVREARPEVVTHLADAAHHLSLALRALADAPAGAEDRWQDIDRDS